MEFVGLADGCLEGDADGILEGLEVGMDVGLSVIGMKVVITPGLKLVVFPMSDEARISRMRLPLSTIDSSASLVSVNISSWQSKQSFDTRTLKPISLGATCCKRRAGE